MLAEVVAVDAQPLGALIALGGQQQLFKDKAISKLSSSTEAATLDGKHREDHGQARCGPADWSVDETRGAKVSSITVLHTMCSVKKCLMDAHVFFCTYGFVHTRGAC